MTKRNIPKTAFQIMEEDSRGLPPVSQMSRKDFERYPEHVVSAHSLLHFARTFREKMPKNLSPQQAESSLWTMIDKAPSDLPLYLAQSAAFLALFDFFGRQSFFIDRDMQSLFDKTSLKDVQYDDVQMPYGTFYLNLPNLDCDLYDESQMSEPVIGSFVAFDPAERTIFFFLVTARGVNMIIPINLPRWLRHEGDFETFLEDVVSNIEIADLERHVSRARVARIRNCVLRVARIAINLALYITSKDADIQKVSDDRRVRDLESKIGRTKNPGKRKKMKRTLTRLKGKGTTHVVGEKLTTKLRRARKMGSRRAHWVRGHWKPSLKKWILPYPRGSKTSTVIVGARTYVMDDDD